MKFSELTPWPGKMLWLGLAICLSNVASAQDPLRPARIETIRPIHLDSLHDKEKRVRRQGGNPRQVNHYLMFDGALDGNRQVDPQIAVGPGHVFHATNLGITIYDKQGNFIDGVNQRGFNGGIDPKVFFDPHHQVFGFDLWKYYDQDKRKPVNISISESADPTAAWNTYAVDSPQARDGGAIGFSKQWVGYSFPGQPAGSFVMPIEDCIQGKPVSTYHFDRNLGHPVNSLDAREGLLFFQLDRNEFVLNEVIAGPQGTPTARQIAKAKHGLEFIGRPPQAPQQGTEQRTAAGDRRPKNIFLLDDHLWFSHTVNCQGRAAVQWHQIKLDGSIVQSGILRHPTNSYIQTTLAVNRHHDVLVGFQETGPEMFISPRFAFRRGTDPPGTLRPIVSMGEGQAATAGTSWGDYSGAAIDGGNLRDLWTVQSIANQRGRGETVIARVPFSDPTIPVENAPIPGDQSPRGNK